jgi:SAM-dependent methyltransferase
VDAPAAWRDFFDDAYPFLYSAVLLPERTEREVAAVSAALRLREGQRLVDLCCGDGRHAVPFCRRGLTVVGVDDSAALLGRADERAGRVLPDDHPRPLWVRADARSVPLRGASADAVVCLFNSLGYGGLGDTRALLAEAARLLRPGGGLVVECDHRGRAERDAGPGPGCVVQEVAQVRGVPVSVERWIEGCEQHACFRWVRDGSALERRLRYRLFDGEGLVALLAGAGFRDVGLSGSYDGRPFARDAPLLVAQARR